MADPVLTIDGIKKVIEPLEDQIKELTNKLDKNSDENLKLKEQLNTEGLKIKLKELEIKLNQLNRGNTKIVATDFLFNAKASTLNTFFICTTIINSIALIYCFNGNFEGYRAVIGGLIFAFYGFSGVSNLFTPKE